MSQRCEGSNDGVGRCRVRNIYLFLPFSPISYPSYIACLLVPLITPSPQAFRPRSSKSTLILLAPMLPALRTTFSLGVFPIPCEVPLKTSLKLTSFSKPSISASTLVDKKLWIDLGDACTFQMVFGMVETEMVWKLAEDEP